MSKIPTLPLAFTRYGEEEMKERAETFRALMSRRHSTRAFSDEPVPRRVLESCLKTAGGAPSGANQQPWHFVVVTKPALKRRIRLAAEAEERAFYAERASEEWLDALSPLGTDAHKGFLERACLIIVFAQAYGLDADGNKMKHYYVQESVGIAVGFLITALHNAGLACLTHTPSPMNFLAEILERPKNERAYLNLVVGYPAKGATFPAHANEKKGLEQFVSFD